MWPLSRAENRQVTWQDGLAARQEQPIEWQVKGERRRWKEVGGLLPALSLSISVLLVSGRSLSFARFLEW